MRTHQEIVKQHGATALVRDLAAIGVRVNSSTPQRWHDRDSIPGEYWKPLEQLGAATLAELAEAAASKSARIDQPAQDAA